MPIADKDSFRPTPNFRGKRQQKLVRVQLYNAQGMLQDIMVKDISARGLSAVARECPPGRGEVVTVQLPDKTTLSGIVRWVDALQFGIEFDVSSRYEDVPTAGLLDSPARIY